MENSRIKALIATGLLDSDPEARFDRLTRLAANALRAPIALISLVDAERQWFKSRVGLEVSHTDRNIAFCDYTIRQPDDLFIVFDARSDPDFADNPLVTGPPHVRFYAGAPLVTRDGYAIGSLCVIDTEPRSDFSEAERQILIDLARSVMVEIEAAADSLRTDDVEVVNRELQHRMGNMYAQMLGVISLLGQSETDFAMFQKRLLEKIQSLAQTQALFVANRYSPVGIGELFDSAMAPYASTLGEGRVSFTGDTGVRVTERAAFYLTLLLSELTTNALKYGALSHAEGTIAVELVMGEDARLSWRESGRASAAEDAPQAGFGTRLLMEIVPLALSGKASRSFGEGGVEYVLTTPPRVLEEKMRADAVS